MARNQAFFSWMWWASSFSTTRSSHLADDLREVHQRVGRLRHRLGTEKIIGRVLVVDRRFFGASLEHPVNVGKKQVALFADVTDLILNVDGQLEIVLPVLSLVAVVRQERIVEENARALEIEAQPVEHDDVRRDEKEVGREVAVRLVELVKIAPCHQQRHDLGLAGAGRELEHVSRPVGVKHVPRDGAARSRNASGRGDRAPLRPRRARSRFRPPRAARSTSETARRSRRPAG